MRANFERDANYPVRSYRVGDKHIAACNGTERVASTCAGHADDVKLLKCAEQITNAVYADRAGGTHYLDRDECPGRGFLVSINDSGGHVDGIDGRYGEVYAAVVKSLEYVKCTGWGGRPIGIGWWTPGGQKGRTFIDVSVVIFDRAEALEYAERADQIAIYDIANKCDIDVRYA